MVSKIKDNSISCVELQINFLLVKSLYLHQTIKVPEFNGPLCCSYEVHAFRRSNIHVHVHWDQNNGPKANQLFSIFAILNPKGLLGLKIHKAFCS